MLTCKGVFEDFEHRRCGIVNQLPAHLRNAGKEFEEGQLNCCLPRTLEWLLAQPIMHLGYRFSLERKLVESVIAMHAGSWLHKNIKPSSILFFPITLLGEFDYEEPYLMGCNFSRLSVIMPDRQLLPRQITIR